VHTSELFLSVITILEVEADALRLLRRDPAQGAVLRSWIDGNVLPAFEGRILPVDTAAAQRCAGLYVPDPTLNPWSARVRLKGGPVFETDGQAIAPIPH